MRRRDFFVVIGLVIISAFLAVFFKLTSLLTTLLFFGLPSGYLIIRKPSNFKKAALGGLLFGLLWGFSFDFIAELNRAWSYPRPLTFPDYFLGVVSLDVMIWFFLWAFLIIAFYEYFVEYDFSKKISPNIRYSIFFGFLTLSVVIALFKTNPDLLRFPYAYLVLGALTLGPFLYVVRKRPKLLHKFLKITPFFVFLYLSFELVALYLNLWNFPGQYLGMIEIWHLRFPLEEFVFWILASSAVAASYHELFIDDQK